MHAPDRFSTMDALRGIAAICVMLFHAAPATPLPMTGGFLAVDLFFCLSGFVIAHAYADRLRAGMTLRAFTLRRVARLWTMVAVGAVLAIALHGGALSTLLLLPDPRTAQLFAANPPLWSLLAEALVNLIFAAAVLHSRPSTVRAGTIVAVGAAAGVLTLALGRGAILSSSGVDWGSFPLGLARCLFGFGAGVLLHALWQRRGAGQTTTWLAALPLLAAVAVFWLLPESAGFAGLAVIVLVVPLLTWAAARWQLPWAKGADLLGRLSYPLYCIHVPVLALHHGSLPERAWLCTALIAAALVLERWYERPARRWLARQFERVRPASASARTAPGSIRPCG